MGDKSGIQWTDATWNPIVGCSVVSLGCTNCYAMKEARRLARMGVAKYDGLTQDSKAGPVWTGDVRLHEPVMDQPLRWQKPRTIFVNSMGDLFHESVPFEWVDRVFAVMALADRHRFQVLTKRADRMREYMTPDPDAPATQCAEARVGRLAMQIARDRGEDVGDPWWDAWRDWPFKHIWLGVSAEDQRRADERIVELQRTPAGMRFVSFEPLLGPIDTERGGFSLLRSHVSPAGQKYAGIDWAIVGGESGDAARCMKLSWASNLVSQCQGSGVPVFVKQLGSRPVGKSGGPYVTPDRKGGNPDYWPADLRVREMPS